MIKLTIEQTKEEYRNDNSVNLSLLWEMVKIKAPEKSISYAIGKKRNVVDKEHILEEKIATLEKELALPKVKTWYKNILIEKLELCRKELEDLVKWRTQGAILRCKARWYNEEEKILSTFFILKKDITNSTL